MAALPQADQSAAVSFDAVVGFVDLAGFTAAAERLSQFGPQGTEQLQDLINYVFTPVIDIVHQAGGEIGWFAGDAVGVLFDRSITDDLAAVHALQRAATGVRDQTPFMTDDGRVFLGVKVGIAGGPVVWKHVAQDPVVAWFGGTAIDLAAGGESHAEPGDIIIHDSVLNDDDRVEAEPIGDGFRRLDSVSASGEPTAVSGKSPLGELQDFRFKTRRVARLATAGQLDFLAEHRPVSSLFVKFPTARHDPLQLEAIVEIVDRHGGFSRATEGDKGAMVLAVFGAPTALADRQELAVLAATEIRGLVTESQIGVTSGRVYSGPIGSPTRWDYSVLGDRVNTAARLMAAAEPGEILVDLMTSDGSADIANFGPHRDLVLKGKSDPERALPVHGTQDRRRLVGGSRFMGRQTEVAELHDRLVTPGLTVVTGAAGTGKSRLVGHVIDQLTEAPVVTSVEPTDRMVPYGLWPGLFASLVGTSTGSVVDVLGAEVTEDQRFPLLGPLLGVVVPETPLTASISPEDRPDLMLEYISEVLESHGTGQPVVVEDLHWSDDASIDLLARVAPRLTRSSVLASARPTTELDVLRAVSSVTELALAPLDSRAMADLAAHVWLGRLGLPAETELVDDVVERAAGSPLFCEQLILFAANQGVDPTVTSLPLDVGIPDTLTDLLLAQLDALPEEAMTAASLAVTFGQHFTEAELVGAFGARYVSDRIVGGLEILRDRRVLSGHRELRFAHSLFAETTYERLSFALRGDLHLDVVRYLEDTRSAELDEIAAVLAHHTERTDDDDRKRRYFRIAADQAAQQWASAVSIRWYEGLLPLLDGHDRGEISLNLGNIKTVSGELSEAEQHLIDAVKDLDEGKRTPAELGLAQVLIHEGSTRSAFDLVDAVINQSMEDQRWTDVHAAMESKADFATILGDIDRAEQVETLHGDLVDRFGVSHPAGAEVAALVPLLWLRGNLGEARIGYQRLYDGAIAEDDLLLASRLAADLAGLSYESADVDGVLRWLEVSATLATRVGDRRRLGIVWSNESAVRQALGDDAGAERTAALAIEVGLSFDDPRGILAAIGALAETVASAFREPLLRRGLVIADALGDESKKGDLLVLLAKHWQATGDAGWRAIMAGRFADPSTPAEVYVDYCRMLAAASDASADDVLAAVERARSLPVSSAARAELLALQAGVDPSTDAAEALTACRIEYAAFPSRHLAARLKTLGAEPEHITIPPASTTLTGTTSTSELLVALDRRPELIDWQESSRRIIADAVVATDP